MSLLLVAVTVYMWTYVPVITGYAAKTMFSGIFVSGRNAVEATRPGN